MSFSDRFGQAGLFLDDREEVEMLNEFKFTFELCQKLFDAGIILEWMFNPLKMAGVRVCVRQHADVCM